MESIGRYSVISELGRGGMATVYKAHDAKFGRDVAIKVLPPEFLHDASFARRFNEEARIIAGLEHRCILPVYDFGEADGIPYIVMRLMTHGSLLEEIRAVGPLPFSRVAHLLSQIADALDYAHANNIVHRDLKPANLLLDDAGNVYLSDFGLAKLVRESQPAQGTIVAGTPSYMAPEQARGQVPTPRTDVYAFGALTFEMLTGRPPFEAADFLALMYLHAHESVPDLHARRPDAPASLQPLLEQAMAKDPAQRFGSAGGLARALIPILLGAPAGKPIGIPAANSDIPMAAEPVRPATSRTTAGHMPAERPVGLAAEPQRPSGQWPSLSRRLGAGALLLAFLACLLLGAIGLAWAYKTFPLGAGRLPVISTPTATATLSPSATPMAPTSTLAALPVILPPTQTVPPTRAPSETQAPTATATPSKPAVLQDVEISTSKYGNDNIRNILPDFPIGEQTLGGVRFTIPASSNKISTQCQSHPDWPVAVQIMTGDVPAPRALFLLINAGYTSGFAGQVIGGIQVNFSDGSRLYFGLTLGQNIREWRIQSTGAVVTTSAGNLTEVYRGASAGGDPGVVDMLALGVPSQYQNSTMKSITVADTSADTVGSLNPCFHVIAVTVRAAR